MKQEGRPNILIIHADQHRADCIGAYGNKEIRTPNIDKLAAEGTLYENCFCPLPICTPSRYSMLTGLFPHQHLGWSNRCTIAAGLDTFPQILRDEGYRTKAVGKMHFTPTYLDVGFQEMVLAEQDGMGRHDDDYHRYLKSLGLVDGIDLMDQVKEYRDRAPENYWDAFGAVESDLDEKHHSTTWIADRAVETLEKWDDNESNLLMVGFIKPHHPFDPPAPWSELYNPEELTVLPGWTTEVAPLDSAKYGGYFPNDRLTETQLRRVMAYYYASISQIDYHFGRMIDVLKRRGMYDNTLIVYTSDHGEFLGFHHLLLKGNYMYDPLMKIPLIVKYTGQEVKGEVCRGMFSNVDMAPTILSQAGCKTGRFMKGLDMAEDAEGHEWVFAENHDRDEYMVRTHRGKLLLCKREGRSQFFDLEKDPMELSNLFNCSEYRQEIEAYKNALYNWILFDSGTPINLDERAKIIDGPNVPSLIDNHRKKSIEYFRWKMNAGELPPADN